MPNEFDASMDNRLRLEGDVSIYFLIFFSLIVLTAGELSRSISEGLCKHEIVLLIVRLKIQKIILAKHY